MTQEILKERFRYEDGNLYYLKPKRGCSFDKPIGTKKKDGYIEAKVDGKVYGVHALIYMFHHGVKPIHTDHINHDVSDNRIENLRAVSVSENARNRLLMSTNKSGHVGVSWHKANNKWLAKITVKGKHKYLGYFDDIEDAIKARKDAEENNFHENHGKREVV